MILQDAVLKETTVLSDAVSQAKSRIVQSPERIKRNISTMGSTQQEDKRILAANEAKARSLHAKIDILLNVEKVIRRYIYLLLRLTLKFRTFVLVLNPFKLSKRKNRVSNSLRKR
jgi:kinetochore protein Nuf2